MERDVDKRSAAPRVDFESLTDVGAFSRVINQIAAGDIKRLAAMNSTDVYRANETALEAATIYYEEARSADSEAERTLLSGYAAKSLTVASMLSELTNVFDSHLGAPAEHLGLLVSAWKSQDPIAHRAVLDSMRPKTEPVPAPPRQESPRQVGKIKKGARIVSVPIALATASAILAAQPAAAAEDKTPVRDETAKSTAEATQGVLVSSMTETQRSHASQAGEVPGADPTKQGVPKQAEVVDQRQSLKASPASEEIIASGIALDTPAIQQNVTNTPVPAPSKQPAAVSPVASAERPQEAVPVNKDQTLDATSDTVRPSGVKEVTLPPMPDKAPASARPNAEEKVSVPAHQSERAIPTPPLSATPVDIDAMVRIAADKHVTGDVSGDRVIGDAAEHKAETVGQSQANVSAVLVPTAPAIVQVNLDTLTHEDPQAVTVDVVVPTAPELKVALPNLDELPAAANAIDEAIVATEPAAQRPVELPKPPEKPKTTVSAPAVEVPAPSVGPEIAAAQAVGKINHSDLPQGAKNILPQTTNWNNIGVMIEYLMTKGELTDSQALGVVANSIVESRGVNPGQHQIGGPAFGIVQWEGGRRAAMEQFARSQGKPVDDMYAQLDFLLLELKRDAWNGYAELKQAKTVREATLIFMNKFERPGVPHEDVRINIGNVITDIYNERLHAQQAAAEQVAKAAADAQLAVAKKEREAANPTWHLPVPQGSRQSPQYKGHQGIDYAVNTGTPFFASIGGTVKVLTYDVSNAQFCKNAMANIGTTMAAIKDPIQKEVRITSKLGDDTYEVIYAHMSKIDVQDGQEVEGGQQLGLTGGSGCSTGPHAHFEIRKNGKAISPTEVLNGVDVRTMSGQVVVVAQGAADPGEFEETNELGHVDVHNEEMHEHDADELTTEQQEWWNRLQREELKRRMHMAQQ